MSDRTRPCYNVDMRRLLPLVVLFLAGCPSDGGGAAVVSDVPDGGSTPADVATPTDTASAVDAQATASADSTDSTDSTDAGTHGGLDSAADDVLDVAPAPLCAPRAAVEPAADFFVDISDASGIRAGNYDPTTALPINDHSRLAFADLDGDGWDDIVMHSLFPNPQAGTPFEHLVFRNLGDGTFADVSDASGLRDVQAGFFTFADVDNDGDQDCFAGLDVPLPGNKHRLLLNDGTGDFVPATGFGPDLPSVQTIAGNAVFGDFDGDAVLDLYIGNGHSSYAAIDSLWLGNGDGSFTNATANLVGNPARPTNGTVTCDYDSDGDLDIFVSTYGVSTEGGLNILWENQGDGVFVDVSVERGFASQPGGNTWLGLLDTPEPDAGPGTYIGSNGFGLDCGDIDADGDLDILLPTISHPNAGTYTRKWSDPTQLLLNQGPGEPFVNAWQTLGLPFNEGDLDGALIDVDHDGRLDISLSRERKYEASYTEADQRGWFGLMRQLPDGTFESLGPTSGINAPSDDALTASKAPCTSTADCPSTEEICHTNGTCKSLLRMKGAQNHAWADIDHDGDVDLLVGGRDNGGGRPNFLFRNDIGQQNRWIALRLVGDGVNVPTDPIGARVTLETPTHTQTRHIRSSRGMHCSADTRAMHFGLGDQPCDYTLAVTWPDGTTHSFPADTFPEETHLTLTYPDVLSP